MKRLVTFALMAAVAAAPSAALAWGSTGHRIIGETAVRALPAEVPAFLRTPQAARDIGEFSREPDRSKSAGKVHDRDRDAGHFLDIDDAGKVLGGPTLAALPPTRADFETALRAVGQDSWKAGYLPYSIVDRWQQLAIDFAYWRVLNAAEANPAWAAHRDFFVADKRRREAQILEDAGALSHFVGDGSQPLHLTVHYNGWGDFPNPGGYPTAHLHGPFESDLVQATVRPEAVAAQVAPLSICQCTIEAQTAAYLADTAKLVEPFYQLAKAGGLDPGDPRGPALATRQIAVGASELRDMMVEAWRASATQTVGWKPVAVADVVAGRIDPYPALYGID
ncbi:S1/P1 Nuclease [Phenylobacterium hankyongense]|uniref:S1/P1 Nuclease n=1 Tax=Phenylobacterium hankyongense TaxID=1813876 RepID=A0A328B7F6_9CAUL|nr:S1/P1 Nuclease [Phenylobacterium hankyongense]RAK60968.1 S1/P1 Nuclease [Phenylobacterium hankyongense]